MLEIAIVRSLPHSLQSWIFPRQIDNPQSSIDSESNRTIVLDDFFFTSARLSNKHKFPLYFSLVKSSACSPHTFAEWATRFQSKSVSFQSHRLEYNFGDVVDATLSFDAGIRRCTHSLTRSRRNSADPELYRISSLFISYFCQEIKTFSLHFSTDVVNKSRRCWLACIVTCTLEIVVPPLLRT